MEYRRLALVLDDEAGQIGELALRLVRLGVNVHYANDLDESILLAHQAADDLGAAVVPSNRAFGWLPLIVKRLHLSPAAVVPAGERPDDATVESLRCEGVRWALWTPEDDGALRFAVTAAMSETDDTELRFDLRVPTDLEGTVQRGNLDQPCAVRNLSVGGALIGLDPLVPTGSQIMLCFRLGDAPIALSATVVWSSERAEGGPAEAGPVMGVQFDDVGPEARDVLLPFLTGEIQRFHL